VYYIKQIFNFNSNLMGQLKNCFCSKLFLFYGPKKVILWLRAQHFLRKKSLKLGSIDGDQSFIRNKT